MGRIKFKHIKVCTTNHQHFLDIWISSCTQYMLNKIFLVILVSGEREKKVPRVSSLQCLNAQCSLGKALTPGCLHVIQEQYKSRLSLLQEGPRLRNVLLLIGHRLKSVRLSAQSGISLKPVGGLGSEIKVVASLYLLQLQNSLSKPSIYRDERCFWNCKEHHQHFISSPNYLSVVIVLTLTRSGHRKSFLAQGTKCEVAHLPGQAGHTETAWSSDLSNGLEIPD